MSSSSATRICVVGCGRWLRRDDQVGLLVAQTLAKAGLPGVRIVATESPWSDILTELEDLDLLIVVDAAREGTDTPPGAWARIDYRQEPERIRVYGPSLDAHQLSVGAALSLASEMGVLPPDVWVYAVAVENCDHGEQVAPAVHQAVSELVERIPGDIDAWVEKGGGHHA
jgi:hydrogenase maturation protease